MRRSLVPLALLILISVLSCERKPTSLIPPAVVADAKSAIAIMSDLPLWTLAQGALTFKEGIPIGEKLALLGPSEKVVQSGKEREYQHVRRESGSEGWVRADFIVSRAILAVITTDDAVLYSAPANTSATTETIPVMTIVAIHSDSAGMSFIRVTCYDAVAKMLLKGVYLRNEGVSSKPSDVQAAILLQLAAASKNAKQKQAFLSSAAKDYPDSIFMPDLTQALAALNAPPPPPPTPTQPASAAVMMTLEDAVSVLDAPDPTAGKVIVTLSKGQKVEIQEQTVGTDTIGGQTAHWYHIKEPAGWVFGSSLGPVQ
ncbi:MAG: SH3 domain-containing protein [Spirochaetia bacterium]